MVHIVFNNVVIQVLFNDKRGWKPAATSSDHPTDIRLSVKRVRRIFPDKPIRVLRDGVEIEFST